MGCEAGGLSSPADESRCWGGHDDWGSASGPAATCKAMRSIGLCPHPCGGISWGLPVLQDLNSCFRRHGFQRVLSAVSWSTAACGLGVASNQHTGVHGTASSHTTALKAVQECQTALVSNASSLEFDIVYWQVIKFSHYGFLLKFRFCFKEDGW